MPDVFSYPISDNDQKLLKQVVDKFGPDIVFNAMWDNIVRFTTFFESLDGYGNTNVAFSGEDLLFSVPATLGQYSEIDKTPSVQPFLSFNARQFFRTTIRIGSAPTLTALKGKIVVGSATADGAGDYVTNLKCYGFKIDGTSLYGVTGDGTAETTLLLGTIAVDSLYNLTAKLFPGEHKVIFYIDGIEKGNIQTRIPVSSATTAEPNFFTFNFTNGENVAGKEFTISLFDFIQDRVKVFAV